MCASLVTDPPRWLRIPEGDSAEAAFARLDQASERLARRCLHELLGRDAVSEMPHLPTYSRRIRLCLQHHGERLGASGPLAVEELVARVEGDDGTGGVTGSQVLTDVTLALALERGHPSAVEKFESEYIPFVRSVARRVSGERGVELVENFAAELVLPRDERPPRIAGFQGRTSFAGWLKVVVVNFCITQVRKKEWHVLERPGGAECAVETARDPDTGECEGLLRPAFQRCVSELSAEDRLLIKMLVLHNVPQKDLAVSLGVHSGSLTRRRQRIGQQLLHRVRSLAVVTATESRVSDCLHLVLAGSDPELRRCLGGLLTEAIEGSPIADTEEAQ